MAMAHFQYFMSAEKDEQLIYLDLSMVHKEKRIMEIGQLL